MTQLFVAGKNRQGDRGKLTAYIEQKIEYNVIIVTKHFATKESLVHLEIRLSQKIYWTSLIQIFTIIGSIIAMFKFFK